MPRRLAKSQDVQTSRPVEGLGVHRLGLDHGLSIQEASEDEANEPGTHLHNVQLPLLGGRLAPGGGHSFGVAG